MPPCSKKKEKQSKRNRTLGEIAHNNLVSEWVSAYTATEEDKCRYVFPHEEEEICRHVPFRVEMWRFNLAYDYSKHFGSRLKNRSIHSTLKLLSKAVNRHQDDVYTDTEIQEQQEREWPDRKKLTLMHLDYWKYHQEKSKELGGTNVSYSVSDDKEPIASPQSIAPASQTVEEGNQEQYDSVIAEGSGINAEVLVAYANLNTESMSVNTQSMDMYSLNQESEDVLLNTEEFNLSIPFTSTQE